MTPDESAYEVDLAINSWTAKDREGIARFAHWHLIECMYDFDACEEARLEVLMNGPALAYFGPLWVAHFRPAPVRDPYDLDAEWPF